MFPHYQRKLIQAFGANGIKAFGVKDNHFPIQMVKVIAIGDHVIGLSCKWNRRG
jgi:hypothetical protein